MKAAQFSSHGTPDQIRINDVPEPRPKANEVRLDVQAAALNHLDLWVLQGLPDVDLDFPHTLGADACGVVDETGWEADRFSEGDRVVLNAAISCGQCEYCRTGQHSQCDSFFLYGEHADGTFAEYLTVPEENCASAPDHLSDTEAAAFPLVFLTAWRMLHTRADLQPGEDVLIHGIGGGVSSAALIIARSFDARCIVTSSSDEKLDRASSLGAAEGINYTTQSVTDRVRSWTDGRGVDVVVDNVGAETWSDSLKCARTGGRIVTCGATTGPSPETNINRIFWKQLSIHGSTMGSHGDFDDLLSWVRRSKVKPVVDQVYPLEDVVEAEQRLQEGKQFGKIVLDLS